MSEIKKIATNKKAFHNYHIEERYEAGIVLIGCEVKSIRNTKINFKDSYAKVINNELWLFNCHISPYREGNRYNADPDRERKLLLKKKEINKLLTKIEAEGYTLVPIQVYFKKNKVKIELGLGKGKKMYDKRSDLKAKEAKLQAERALKRSY